MQVKKKRNQGGVIYYDINYNKGWELAFVFTNIKLVVMVTGDVSVEWWGKDSIGIDL